MPIGPGVSMSVPFSGRPWSATTARPAGTTPSLLMELWVGGLRRREQAALVLQGRLRSLRSSQRRRRVPLRRPGQPCPQDPRARERQPADDDLCVRRVRQAGGGILDGAADDRGRPLLPHHRPPRLDAPVHPRRWHCARSGRGSTPSASASWATPARAATSWTCYGGAGTDPFEQEFTGKERDDESDLDYFGARYFSASLGRFTGPDAPFLDQWEQDPQSWNLYGYVRNNPLVFVDPNGEDCVYTSNRSESSVTVEVEQGTCSREGGTFVDGTIDQESFVYTGSSLDFGYAGADGSGGAHSYRLRLAGVLRRSVHR